MIHFFPTFSASADSTPLGEELRRIGTPYRIFASQIRLEFRRRIFILLLGYPKLAWFALRSAWRSMVLSRPRPDAVVLGSDVEVLVFALLRSLLPWRGPCIALLGFIYTAWTSPLINRLRALYYRFVLARCDCIICHSRLEITRYRRLFPRSAARFVFVRWGGNVHGHDQPAPPDPEPHRFRVLAAGRSGRDYPTLVQAIRGTHLDVTIICDTSEGLGGITERQNVRILRSCYGDNYLAELRRSDVVVLPLAVDDISVGQMVMIQAMAFGKPLVVTRTPTVEDYITEGVEGFMVARGEPQALRETLLRLQNDPDLCSRLGEAGRAAYLARFSQSVVMRATLDAIAGACAS